MLKKIKSMTEDFLLDRNRSVKSEFRTLTMCKECYTFYYKKSWHFERPEYLKDYIDQEVPVRFTQCPACVEQELAMYDSESNMVLGRA